jgi:predicted RND superfamily exporter protein
VVTAERLVPDDQDEKLFLLEDLSLVLGPDFHRINDAPFDAAELDAAMVELAEALAGQDRRSAVALAAALNSWLERDGASADLSALDRALRSDLPERLADFERLLGASPITLEDLPAALRERWINDDGQQLIEIAPRENLNDNEAAARFVTEVRDVLPSATGLPVVYQEASSTIVRAFLQALSLALAMVAVLLVLFMRSIRDVLLVLIPILFAAAVTAGLAVLFGLPFNFANIIALPLLIGVGVDNGIHMVHRMQTEPPPDAEPLHTSTSRAVLASGLTTIASFGNLAFSAHYGMSSMGQLLTIGMLVTLVATLVLLPALIKLRAA